MRLRHLLALALALLAAGPASAGERPATSILVVTHAWHTEIVVRTADVPRGHWPDAERFAGAEFVSVGWGDRDFWMAPRETVGLAVKAALASAASVLRVLWFDGPPEHALPASDIVEVPLSRVGLEALLAFVAATYARAASGAPIDLGPGPLPDSRYYLATGRYHLFNTSNRWTARALARAGLPFTGSSLTAGNVMCQAARIGRVIRLREKCATSAPTREGP